MTPSPDCHSGPAGFDVRVSWGRFVPLFPDTYQTKVTITVPDLPPVTLLLTGGLTPQAPWGDLACQAIGLLHAGRGITGQRADLGRLHNWLAQPGHRDRLNQAWAGRRQARLTADLIRVCGLLTTHCAEWGVNAA